MLRLLTVVFACFLAFSASAQTVTTYRAKPAPRVPAPKAAPYNSAAKDTTPLNCDRPEVKHHLHPAVRPLCEGWEARLLRDEARRQGRPGPSDSVVPLPALGTSAAKATGLACIGGQGFRKIPNGWEQLYAGAGGWQRCTGG